jgi:hypothetical protein
VKLHSTRAIGGVTFILAEKLDDYRTASLAQAEYWAEGLCCRKEPVQPKRGPGYYHLWLGPERQRKIRLLDGETITRERNSRILRVS